MQKNDKPLAWTKNEKEAGAFMLDPQKKKKIMLFTWTLLQPASSCTKH